MNNDDLIKIAELAKGAGANFHTLQRLMVGGLVKSGAINVKTLEAAAAKVLADDLPFRRFMPGGSKMPIPKHDFHLTGYQEFLPPGSKQPQSLLSALKEPFRGPNPQFYR